jgi:DNA-binding transcriptional LysR family regulator
VSQQIRRLEQSVGRPLLSRDGRRIALTEEGERLLSYARRLLALAQEARDVLGRPTGGDIVRLGLPEDFAAHRLAAVLSQFMRSRPGLRLDVRCDLSVLLRGALERGELDLILFKREAGESGGITLWPERLSWVTSRSRAVDIHNDPVPLVVFPQGCLYRDRAIHALETAGRTWYVAYTSPNFSGIQAAVSVGFGVSILPHTAVAPSHRVLTAKDGFPKVGNTELALLAASDASPATRALADLLAVFCTTAGRRRAA